MKKAVTFLSIVAILIFLILIQVIPSLQDNKSLMILNQSSKKLFAENPVYKNLLTFETSKLDNRQIKVYTSPNENFDQLSNGAKFGVLEFYAKHLRYTLRNEINNKKYHFFDIIIHSDSHFSSYELLNSIQDKNQMNTSSALLINGEEAYTSSLFKIELERIAISTPYIKEDEIEILNYARKLYNQLTVGGKYFDFKKDSKIILDIVTDKFDITMNEYTKIYQKYYFMFN